MKKQTYVNYLLDLIKGYCTKEEWEEVKDLLVKKSKKLDLYTLKHFSESVTPFGVLHNLKIVDSSDKGLGKILVKRYEQNRGVLEQVRKNYNITDN
jgi:hypothetical protein